MLIRKCIIAVATTLFTVSYAPMLYLSSLLFVVAQPTYMLQTDLLACDVDSWEHLAHLTCGWCPKRFSFPDEAQEQQVQTTVLAASFSESKSGLWPGPSHFANLLILSSKLLQGGVVVKFPLLTACPVLVLPLNQTFVWRYVWCK